ncbi:YIP1 family protein [Cognatishimia sp. F0-27]|uniref:YIP1 family protein n=1 Tax=Cognatishimia sp. F0-27 TaxID=2816855 RepID=UPI001D0C4204|nr:YIP1 family protein [Cognatishimia sp. F0-27]MCC1491650.1 YIP1 family protein [Cognatishimia sp. F0-27]
MPMSTDIAATYRGPGRVIRRLLALGPHEGRALAILMGACVIMFVAQWPRIARDAHLAGDDRQMMIAGALLGWIFVVPLVFYIIAFVLRFALRLFGLRVTGFQSRLVLFWGFAAASPLFLLVGLTRGFIGPGPEHMITGALWAAALAWFWIRGYWVAAQPDTADA